MITQKNKEEKEKRKTNMTCSILRKFFADGTLILCNHSVDHGNFFRFLEIKGSFLIQILEIICLDILFVIDQLK